MHATITHGLRLTAVACLLASRPAVATAQSTSDSAPSKTTAAILVAHGGGDEWNAKVEALAAALRSERPVEVAYLMGDGARAHRFQDAVKRLEKQAVAEIVVVPVLVSSFSGHYDQVRYLAGQQVTLDTAMSHHLHMAGLEPANTSVPLRITRAIDDAPELARVLADRALAIAPAPAGRALFIIGHGPNSAEDYAEWMARLRIVADSVSKLTGFADVRIELMRDDAPAHVRAEAIRRIRDLIELQHAATKQDVVVVPVLVARGDVNNVKVPRDLAGLPIAYRGDGLLFHPAMVAWAKRRIQEAASAPVSSHP
ncbi:MAG: hypothetical protein MNPFHGCM_00491 [Gemmatimonadaceae bacterium]|nr:hypothetical protein [Gemmatimonadaceae bacterium]